MAGLNKDQLSALIKGYHDHRAGFPGPTLTSSELRQAIADIEALLAQPGSPADQVAQAARIRRAGQPNPLAAAGGRGRA